MCNRTTETDKWAGMPTKRACAYSLVLSLSTSRHEYIQHSGSAVLYDLTLVSGIYTLIVLLLLSECSNCPIVE